MRLVALTVVAALGCQPHKESSATKAKVTSDPITSASTAAPPPPPVDPCAGSDQRRALASLADAGKAAGEKKWTTALKAYDDAVTALGPCPSPLRARALAERGYVKLRAKDFAGARTDLVGGRDEATDDDLLGAIHFNLALLADAQSKRDEGFSETALSLGFRSNATVRARLSAPCGVVEGDDEKAGVRYATVADACKALGKTCGPAEGGAPSAASLCAEGATALPCVVEGPETGSVPWPKEELPGDVVVAAAGSPLSLIVQDGGDLWVYPAGIRISSWRCGGAPGTTVKTSGSVILVTYVGSTGAIGTGPGAGCADGYDVASYAAISTKRHTTATSFTVLTRDNRPACP